MEGDGIVRRLRGYGRLVEVGIGERHRVAAELAREAHVTATDIVPRSVPQGVEFVIDDVTAPTPGIYADADVIYARNLPPELHRPVLDLARDSDAVFAFTTLGGDHPTVDADPETLDRGTLFWARGDPRR